ncbi:MAG: hypothetical protein INR69_13560 [Mucilaginibacter polytrichastri]|nr:hypothetical protein [Mucilaginibacter polytrichastri]
MWQPVFAQQNSLDIHFNGLGFMDNREYKAFTERSNTYFGIRAALDVGVNLADSTHHFRFGANGIHEFGAQPYMRRVDPVIYYQYTKKGWQFNVGAFPRQGLLDDYPRALLNDTLRYFRPNVEGMLARYETEFGFENIWIDWVSRQTATDREQFLFGLSGKYIPTPGRAFYLSHYFHLLHDAGPAVPIPDDHIRDNGGGQLRIGFDLSHRTALDSLTFEAGGMISLERERALTGLRTPLGAVATAYLGWKRFALRDEFYAGEGHTVSYGDAYFMKKIYNRIDISWAPFVAGGVQGKFVFSFHQSPGNLGDSQQAFFLTFDLGRKKLLDF